jgi:hypothetical protein
VAKRIKFDGVEHVFPDDFTDEEIQRSLEALPPQNQQAFHEQAKFPPDLGTDPRPPALRPSAPPPPDRTLQNVARVADKVGAAITDNPIEKSGGTTLTKLYEGAGEGLQQIVEKAAGRKYSQMREELPVLKTAELVGNLGSYVPKAIDSLYTPAGAAMAALPAMRMVKSASPHLKAAIGATFATPQAEQFATGTVPAALKDPNPKSLADVAVQGAMTVLPFMANRANPAHQQNRRKAETVAIDDTAPLRHFEQDAGGVPMEKSAHVQARVSKGLPSVIEGSLKKAQDVLPKRAEIEIGTSPYGINPLVTPTKKLELVDRYSKLQEYEHGFLKNRRYETPEGYNRNTLSQAILDLETKMGPELTAEVQKYSSDLRRERSKKFAQVHAAGIISDEHYANTLAKYPDGNVPLKRIAYISDNLDKLPTGSSAWNMASQNLVRKRGEKGSTLAVANTLESVVEDIVKADRLIERQKVAMKLAAHANNPAFKGMIEAIPDGADPGPGRGTFNVLQNGKKLTFAVPKDVADTMKGLNKEQADLVTTWASKSAAALRAGATTLYLPFLPANMIRDYQTAHVTSGLSPIDWVKGFAEGIKKGKDYELFMRSGGGQGGLYGQSGLSQMDRRTASLKDLTADPLTAGIKALRPDRMLQSVGEKIELAPRLGVFKKALYGGESPTGAQSSPMGLNPRGFSVGPRGAGVTSDPTVAAFLARNSTVDFSKAGSAGRIVNRWIPFLNARLQGNINFYGALKNNPPEASALRLGMVVGLPVLATHVWNSQFPEVMKDMAEHEKDQNFVIVGGPEKDSQGRWTNVLKLPKGEVAPFATLLESYLDYTQKKDPKSYQKLAMEVMSGMSPLPFEREGKIAPERAVGAVIPPLARGVIENVANKNFHTGQPIVKEEYTRTGADPENQYPAGTPELFVRGGKAMGVAPQKLQNLAVAQFGGLGRVAAFPSKSGGAIANRFIGATGGAGQQKDFEIRDEARREVGNRAMEQKRAVEAAVQQIMDAPPEQRMALYRQALPADPEQREDFQRRLLTGMQKKQAAIDHETFARVLKTDPPEVRAATILKKLATLLTPEEKAEFLKAMQTKRIIIPEVIRHMQKLTQQPVQ